MAIRIEHELPECITNWGWKFHHLGIPTNVKMPGEKYIPHLKISVSGFSTSPFGVEWMRFDADSEFDELIKSIPHLAFEVTNLENEIVSRNLNVLTKVNSPAKGIKVAMIEHNGAPVELIEFEKNK